MLCLLNTQSIIQRYANENAYVHSIGWDVHVTQRMTSRTYL